MVGYTRVVVREPEAESNGSRFQVGAYYVPTPSRFELVADWEPEDQAEEIASRFDPRFWEVAERYLLVAEAEEYSLWERLNFWVEDYELIILRSFVAGSFVATILNGLG